MQHNYYDHVLTIIMSNNFSLRHYQVSVESIETVACVGVIVRLGLPVAYVVHDLVLSLSRNLPTEINN